MTNTTGTILDRIVANKRGEIAAAKARMPLADMRSRAEETPAPRGFAAALRVPGISMIAEVKKGSPSRGTLREDFDPVWLAGRYAEGGAAAISVLTDEKHFSGSLAHLAAIRDDVPDVPPLLRKDFIFDDYQVYESRAAGADAVLFIVAILEDQHLGDLIGLAGSIGLDALVEVHDRDEMETAESVGAELIGINNRDLHTFEVDIATTERLCKHAPRGATIVAESGIFTREDMLRVERCGVHAVLIGEGVVTAEDPAAKVRELLGR